MYVAGTIKLKSGTVDSGMEVGLRKSESVRDSPADEPAAYLFKIVVGPTYKEEDFEPTLRLLSQRFTGELWSYGSYQADTTLGRMRLRVVKDRSRVSRLNYLRFARAVIRRARELRVVRPPQRLVVTSYDPFLGGLLAWRVARLLGGVFVCEVNGDYGDPDNFADIKSRAWSRARLLQMRVLGSFVLRRADAVRLLFADQLRNFVTLPPHTIVRRFFALSFTERFHEGPEEPFILSAGYPFERKGVDVLVRAFTRIAAEFPSWKLVLIGHRVPEQLRARGMQHAQITALPGMPQSQLTQWMSRCSIFALASRSEAMGRVLIEAAAARKCRIASRVGGIPTVIEHGKDGILVEKADVEALSAALRTLLHDEQLRHRLANEAQRRIAQEFSGAAYLGHFEELIAATLQASASTVPAGLR
jgi:glycosyltransferase involved in cell wall biosynthesis